MDARCQDQYHDLGPDYFWLAGKRKLALALLSRHLPPTDRTRRILDVGCGPGHDLDDLRALGTVVGLDASLPALQLCRARDPQSLVVCAAGGVAPFPERTFDLLVLLDVLEHVDDDATCLSDCERLLRPGGRLLITVPAFRWLWGRHDTAYGHRRRYTVKELRTKLRAAGFTVERVTYVEWLFTLPMWVMRRIKALLPGWSSRDDFVRVAPWLNRLLTTVITAELPWLTRGGPPWGVSIIGIAQAGVRE